MGVLFDNHQSHSSFTVEDGSLSILLCTSFSSHLLLEAVISFLCISYLKDFLLLQNFCLHAPIYTSRR